MEIKEVTSLVTDKLEGWINAAIKMLPNLAIAIFVVVLFYFVARVVRSGIHKIDERTSGNAAIMKIIANMVFIGIVLLGLFAALSVMQLDKAVTSILAGAGIIGLALGFAFQETAANFLAGILMAFRKPIRLGDIVSSNDHMGTVEELNIRATVLRNFQGQYVIIPNKEVLYNPIINYSKNGERRMDLQIGVSYGDDLAKVKKITLDAVKDIEGLSSSKPVMLWFEEFGDSSINFTLALWLNDVAQAKFRTFKSDIVMSVKTAFDQNDIMIPFPIRTLDFGIKGGEKLEEMKIQMLNSENGNARLDKPE